MAKICKNCGSKIDDEAVFCAKCGKKIAVSGALPVPSDNNKSKSLGPDYATRDEALNWFSYRGRLNRQRYIVRSLILSVPSIIFAIMLAGGMSFAISAGAMNGNSGDEVIGMIFILLFVGIIFGLPLIILGVFATIKRGHDVDIPGYVTVLVSVFGGLIGISLFYSFYLWFAKGNEGPNQYGENPLKYPGSI